MLSKKESEDYANKMRTEGYNCAFTGGKLEDNPWAYFHEEYEWNLWIEGFNQYAIEQELE